MGMGRRHQNFTDGVAPIGIAIGSGPCRGGALSTYLCWQPVPGFSAEGGKPPPARALLGAACAAPWPWPSPLGLPTTLPYPDAVVTSAFAWLAYSSDSCRGLSITPLHCAPPQRSTGQRRQPMERLPEGQQG